MPRAKATNLINMREYVREHHGESAWERVLAGLDPADRSALSGMLALEWRDLELQLRLLHRIDDTLGEGRFGVIPAIGRYEADQDLTRIHRMFLRLANPAFVLEKAGEYWARFYDSGRWEIRRLSPTSARGVLHELELVDEAFCVYLTHYIQRMFELVGAVDPAVEHPHCRVHGASACVFHGSWTS